MRDVRRWFVSAWMVVAVACTTTIPPNPSTSGADEDRTTSGNDGGSLGGDDAATLPDSHNPDPGSHDAVPPKLLASTPTDGAQNVPVDAKLRLVFSEPMARASVILAATDGVSFGGPVWSIVDTTEIVEFTPSPSLPYDAEITVQVQGTDVAGNALGGAPYVTFHTGPAPDLTAPTVVTIAPAQGAQGVPLGASISVTFSESMDTAVAPATILELSPDVSCTYAWSNADKQLTCTHDAALSGSTAYTATVSTSAKDKAGNPLAATATFAFTTGATPDTTPPSVTSVTPASSSTAVSTRATISIAFSEPMDQAKTQAAFTLTGPVSGVPGNQTTGTVAGTFSFSPDGRTMSFTPTSALLPAVTDLQNFTIKLTTAATDLAGNSLPTALTSTFRSLVHHHVILYSDAAMDGEVSKDTTKNPSSYGSWSGGSIVTVGQKRAGVIYRALVSFPFAVVGAGAEIVSAQFRVVQNGVDGAPNGGDPYNVLGDLVVQRVSFNAFGAEPYPIPTGGGISICTSPGCRTVSLGGNANVTGFLRADVTAQVKFDIGKPYSQFRIYFPENLNAWDWDRFAALCMAESGSGAQLEVEYLKD